MANQKVEYFDDNATSQARIMPNDTAGTFTAKTGGFQVLNADENAYMQFGAVNAYAFGYISQSANAIRFSTDAGAPRQVETGPLSVGSFGAIIPTSGLYVTGAIKAGTNTAEEIVLDPTVGYEKVVITTGSIKTIDGSAKYTRMGGYAFNNLTAGAFETNGDFFGFFNGGNAKGICVGGIYVGSTYTTPVADTVSAPKGLFGSGGTVELGYTGDLSVKTVTKAIGVYDGSSKYLVMGGWSGNMNYGTISTTEARVDFLNHATGVAKPIAVKSLFVGNTYATPSNNDIQLEGGVNLEISSSTGTKIGTATTALIGFYGATPVDQPAAVTTQLTTITFTAPVTPDYAIADLTQTTPYGFASSDEAQTLLSVIANLQTRVQELEDRLQELGLIA